MDETETVAIRRATLDDVPAITAIYNEAVLTSLASFDLEPKSLDDRLRWFEQHDERHPVLVAEVQGAIVGWTCLTMWSDKRAYDDTAESTFYVNSAHRGQGIGRQLKAAIIAEARRLGFHTLIARMTETSAESIHLNECFGFVHVGTLREVGRKFGRVLDVHIMQKMLE